MGGCQRCVGRRVRETDLGNGTAASAAAHDPRGRAAPTPRWAEQTRDEGAGSSAGRWAAVLLLAPARKSAGGEPTGCEHQDGCRMQIATLTGPCSPPRQRIGDGPCPEPRSTLLTLGGGGRSSKKSGNTSQSWSKVQHISLGRPYARLQGFPSPPSGRTMATCGAGPRLDCGRGRPSCPTGLSRLWTTSGLW